MLTPPGGLPPAMLAGALGRSWGIAVASAVYRPACRGSHHREVADALPRPVPPPALRGPEDEKAFGPLAGLAERAAGA